LTIDLEQYVFVGESQIHGTGLFTTIHIPKGSKIMLITGELISEEECIRRENEKDNVYIFWKNDDCYIDTTHSTKIKYINHDCYHNCEVIDGDESSLILITSRDISKYEELTIDYGYEEIYAECNCRKCA
jgi:SET domain-containing protein